MLDPAMHLIIAIAFSLLWVIAGWHKLSQRRHFQGILQAYRLVPAVLIPAATLGLGVLELALGLGWALRRQPELVATVTAALLLVYALAMGINLARGRRHIDCGCGFASTATGNDAQQLRPALLLRNLGLALLALGATLPVTTRSLGWFDYTAVAAACLCLALLYGAGHQLMLNRNAIDSWRSQLRSRTDV